MSLNSWKKEFYPISASDAAKKSWTEATLHCIKKWTGALPKNRQRHDVSLRSNAIYSGRSRFYFNGDSCALCQRDEQTKMWSPCESCPLFKSRGDFECFISRRGEKVSPYEALNRNGLVTPMLIALRKALPMAKKMDAKKNRP